MLTQPHAARAQDGPDPDRLCPGGGPLSAVSGGTLGRGSGARVSFHESAKVLAPAAPLSCARALVRPPERAWRPAVVRCSARCRALVSVASLHVGLHSGHARRLYLYSMKFLNHYLILAPTAALMHASQGPSARMGDSDPLTRRRAAAAASMCGGDLRAGNRLG